MQDDSDPYQYHQAKISLTDEDFVADQRVLLAIQANFEANETQFRQAFVQEMNRQFEELVAATDKSIIDQAYSIVTAPVNKGLEIVGDAMEAAYDLGTAAVVGEGAGAATSGLATLGLGFVNPAVAFVSNSVTKAFRAAGRYLNLGREMKNQKEIYRKKTKDREIIQRQKQNIENMIKFLLKHFPTRDFNQAYNELAKCICHRYLNFIYFLTIFSCEELAKTFVTIIYDQLENYFIDYIKLERKHETTEARIMEFLNIVFRMASPVMNQEEPEYIRNFEINQEIFDIFQAWSERKKSLLQDHNQQLLEVHLFFYDFLHQKQQKSFLGQTKRSFDLYGMICNSKSYCVRFGRLCDFPMKKEQALALFYPVKLVVSIEPPSHSRDCTQVILQGSLGLLQSQAIPQSSAAIPPQSQSQSQSGSGGWGWNPLSCVMSDGTVRLHKKSDDLLSFDPHKMLLKHHRNMHYHSLQVRNKPLLKSHSQVDGVMKPLLLIDRSKSTKYARARHQEPRALKGGERINLKFLSQASRMLEALNRGSNHRPTKREARQIQGEILKLHKSPCKWKSLSRSSFH